MPVLPDQCRSPRGKIEPVLDGAAFGRRMARTVIDQEQIAVRQQVSVVLNAESVHWIANQCELIVATTESPDHLSGGRVDLADFTEVGEGDDVVPVSVAHERVR